MRLGFSPPEPQVDLLPTAALEDYGRFAFLGPAQDEVGSSFEAQQIVEPLSNRLFFAEPAGRAHVATELTRHAAAGGWSAIGAWKFADQFGVQTEGVISAAMEALHAMRITNLWRHLGEVELGHYEAVNGERPMDDGFVGPPVFDSDHGPSRRYLFDRAVAHAAARRPVRLPSRPGVEVSELGGVDGPFFELGRLLLLGSTMVADDASDESVIVQAPSRAATGVDHGRYAAALLTEMTDERNAPRFTAWTFAGAARFVEDYLDAGLTGSDVHIALVDRALHELRPAVDQAFSRDVLSSVERERLAHRS